MPTCKLTKKTFSHILPHEFCLHFPRIQTITFSEEALKECEHISFRKYKRKLVIYQFNDDSSESIFFMLNMEYILLGTAFVK